MTQKPKLTCAFYSQRSHKGAAPASPPLLPLVRAPENEAGTAGPSPPTTMHLRLPPQRGAAAWAAWKAASCSRSPALRPAGRSGSWRGAGRKDRARRRPPPGSFPVSNAAAILKHLGLRPLYPSCGLRLPVTAP